MSYYTVTGAPVQDTRGTSPSIRAEFALIAAGFAALPVQATIWGASQNYGVDSGSADAYVVSIAATYITGYTDGLTIKVKAANANTGPATINLNTLGIKSIVRPDGTALIAGDIPAGSIITLTYNTTTGKFQLALSSVASATSAAASAAAALASQLAAAASAAAAANSATASANSATAAAASAASINPADLMHLSGVETATGNKTFSGTTTLGATVITGALSGAGVTKAAVGLGNVDNTSDANKPVSTAQQTALDLKANLSLLQGMRNRIINGNFAINQRAVASGVVLAAGAYGHDRWKAGAAGCTYTFTASGNDTILTISAGSLMHVIEDKNVEGGVYALQNAGTAQARIAVNGAATSGAYAAATNAAPLASASATGNQTITVEFTTGTVSKVQLEPGTAATAFERRPFGTELALCQRYYEKSFPYATAPAGNVTAALTSVGSYQSAATISFPGAYFKVSKRAAPTMVVYDSGSANTGSFSFLNPSGTINTNVPVTITADENSFFGITTSAAAGTTSQASRVQGNWTASAEL